MDLSRQALPTNGKLFFPISESFQLTFFLNNMALCLCKRGGGGICSDHHAFYLSVLNIYCFYQLWLTHGRDCFDEKVEGRT